MLVIYVDIGDQYHVTS